MRWRAFLGTLLVASLATLAPARAAESLQSPFTAGQAVRVIQAYNGGTHQGRSRFALDLVLAGGGTTGAQVVAPIEGRVAWAMPPGSGNGCMAIALRDGSYSVAMCHVLFERAFARGESIARGQVLGTVGAAGTLGNNGTPHLHLELHRGSQARDPVPFESPAGLPLEGVNTPAAPAPAPQPAAPKPAAAAAAAPAAQAPASAAAQAPAPAAARLATIVGTDSCLNVRETPSTDALVTACLPDGTQVALAAPSAEAAAGWRQVADKGWVVSDFLKLTRAVVTGTDSCLNVREDPSLSAPIVGCLAEGTSVTLAEGPRASDGRGWFRVPAGWVVDAFLG